ncbi:MAG TPA: hypothetical protein VEH53_04340 [archaeon]|nr:hypothetical protein [archaeon]
MSHVLIAHGDESHASAGPATGALVAIVLAFWLALVLWLGAGEMFVTPRGALPLRLLIAVASPVIVFVSAFWMSQSFQEFVLAADPRLMVGVQAWRFAGFGFLALYTHGVLPGRFAWPAGLGDMAIGVTAPWMLVALIRRPGLAASKTFVTWNVFGILDLLDAVALGALGARLAVDLPTTVTTAPMSHLPLVLIPAYFVPVFFMLHLAALFQARRMAEFVTRRA